MKVFFQPITLPLHHNEVAYPRDGKNEQYQGMNTRHSTNPTPRQQSHDHIQLRNSGLFKSRNHITLVQPARAGQDIGVAGVESKEGVLGQRGSQRLFKSLKSIRFDRSKDHQSRQRSGRRNKIFENRDGLRDRNRKQVKPLVTILYQNQSNCYRNRYDVSSQNYFQDPKAMRGFGCQGGNRHQGKQQRCAQRQSSHGFISGIREQTSRLVRVNSSNLHFNQAQNLSHSSLNKQTPSKVTFSYNNQAPNAFVSHQASQPIIKPSINYQPINASLTYQSPISNYNFIRPIQIHQNPILNKIKKPNPTQRKGTLIDQITYENVSSSKVQRINSVDYNGYNQHQQYNSVGSKVSLGSNIKDSIMGGRSLATDKLKIGESFSNISEDNSNQRYFDDEEGEDLIFKQKISYKNIEIENQNQENVQHWQQINAQNIFCDFEQSRRNQQQHSLQKQKKPSFFKTQPLQTPKSKQPQQILQKSTLILKSQPPKSSINIPLLLIIISSLLLFLQLLN